MITIGVVSGVYDSSSTDSASRDPVNKYKLRVRIPERDGPCTREELPEEFRSNDAYYTKDEDLQWIPVCLPFGVSQGQSLLSLIGDSSLIGTMVYVAYSDESRTAPIVIGTTGRTVAGNANNNLTNTSQIGYPSGGVIATSGGSKTINWVNSYDIYSTHSISRYEGIISVGTDRTYVSKWNYNTPPSDLTPDLFGSPIGLSKYYSEDLGKEFDNTSWKYTITSPYGPRAFYPNLSKIYTDYGLHNGIDISSNTAGSFHYSLGTPILAVYDGEVVQVSSKFFTDNSQQGMNGDKSKISTSSWDSYGNFACIRHSINGKTYYTRYAHLMQLFVKVGDKVVKGQEIGYMGSTGNSTQAHLHFEMMYDTGGGYIASKSGFNPEPYVVGKKVIG